eukprot:TRINITY_DN33518_c0_g1_i1.p1 TRINITY_DN33518_c0_g1~~TRINITY_DN33518_c0_g1_i1.p1  ORF type:complete len:879 (+),score=183.86 TRINITY_DN33518_c0_g1_i1:84-2720(+)
MVTVEDSKTELVGFGVGLLYDPRMVEHQNLDDATHPEQPLRVVRIFERLQSEGLVDRCIRIPCREASREELKLKHTDEHVDSLIRVADLSPEEAAELGRQHNSVYLCPQSTVASLLAAGSVVEATARVCAGEVGSAVCIVRPPGHHAERDRPMGFCLFGSVSLAVAEARRRGWSERTLIVDWDVHHGNGTQRMFEEDPTVLYFSTHRHDNGSFYPSGRLGHYESHGLGHGAGYSVNVPWNVKFGQRQGFEAPGDGEIIDAFDRVLLPIAAEFAPDLVLVSAGFDAAAGDPIGGCRVTPNGYHALTRRLLGLANGRLVLALEGGYNLDSISASMAACVRALLGEDAMPPPPPLVPPAPPLPLWAPPPSQRFYAAEVDDVVRHFLRFWASLTPPPVDDVTTGKDDLELPPEALTGDIRGMRRAIRRLARSSGISIDRLRRQQERVLFKLDSGWKREELALSTAKRQRAMQQSFACTAAEAPYMVPIVFIGSLEQVVRNVAIAKEAGAHGVWLINAGHAPAREDRGGEAPPTVRRVSLKAAPGPGNDEGRAQLEALAKCFDAARNAYPDFWLGLSVPQLNAAQVFTWLQRNCPTADGLWLDDLPCCPAETAWETLGGSDIRLAVRCKKWLTVEDQIHLQAVKLARKRCGWLGIVFGSVASRSQDQIHHDQDSEDMGEAPHALLSHWASLAGSVCDAIVTTRHGSGGGPCAAAKLRAMSIAKPVACLGRFRLDAPAAAAGAAAVGDDGRGSSCAPSGGGNVHPRFIAASRALGVDLFFTDAAELNAAALAEQASSNLLDFDLTRLKAWVTEGTIQDPVLQEGGDAYRPGEIREMATAALADLKQRRSTIGVGGETALADNGGSGEGSSDESPKTSGNGGRSA